MKYHKLCKFCSQPFESESRNQRYCSQECCDKAQAKNYKMKKSRAKKRKDYEKSKEVNQALSTAYTLAHRVAELFKLPHRCMHPDCSEETCRGSLELHHKDVNPFNNSPDNLIWYCEFHHKATHNELGDVNVITTYNQAVEDSKVFSEDTAHTHIIGDFISTVKKATEG